MIRVRTVLCLLVALCLVASAHAGGGGQNVAVVVNSDSWASRTIANEYVRLRQIPPANVVTLRLGDLQNFETVSVDVFRDRILGPVLKALETRKLVGLIDYVAYSSDVPYAINAVGDFPKGSPRPRRQPIASVNGLTFLYPYVIAKDARRYLSLAANFYYPPPKRPGQQRTPWTLEERTQLTSMQKLIREKNWAQTEDVLRTMLKARPESPLLTYNLACVLARQDKADAAVAALAKAVQCGYVDRARAERDADLESLRKRKDFGAVMASIKSPTYHWMRARKLAKEGKDDQALAALRQAVREGLSRRIRLDADPTFAKLREQAAFKAIVKEHHSGKHEAAVQPPPSRAFHNGTFWAPGGQVVEKGKGLRFLISTMLACTSGRGNSVDEALRCLRRARRADGTCPKGTVYYMRNGDIRSRTRQWGFAGAVAALEKLGVRGEIVDGRLPAKRDDVAGLMAGSASFNWPASGSTILPGAICEHLTSFGGVMRQRAGQTCIREFIRYGAAGSAGTVTEPYAIQAKFPTPFVHVYYARGHALGEALYQSVAGPYQLLMLGDPLCAPWAKPPEFTMTGLTDGQVVKGTLTCTAKFAPAWAGKVGRLALYLDGRPIRAIRPASGECELVLNFAKVPDGYHELRVVAVSGDAVEAQRAIVAGIRVANHGRQVKVTCDKPTASWGETITVRAGLAGAKRIEIRHDDAVLASADAATLTAKLDTQTLGMGAARLIAVAMQDKAKGRAGEIRSTPITLTIQPPAALPAVAAPKGTVLKPGLLIAPAGGKGAHVKNLQDLFAAEKAAKVGKGKAFAVTGWFDATEAGLHQFQIRHPGEIVLKVDGRAMPIPPAKSAGAWRFVPINLAKGTHRFELACKPAGRPVLDLRFGLRGAQTPDEKRFRAPVPE